MKKRWIGGLIFSFISIIMLFYMGWIGQIIYVLCVLFIAMWEIIKMSLGKLTTIKQKIFVILYCMCVLIFAIVAIFLFKLGTWTVFFPVIIIIFSDMFAYFGGRLFGKNLLAKKISKNKTIEGSIIGIIATIILSIMIYYIFDEIAIILLLSLDKLILFIIIVAIVGQIGDLLESKLKRIYKIKDSGTIILGHGGILDRMDGYIFGVGISAIIYLMLGII